ncbi:hypothetical protein BD289DRAFT_491918 [Coniella lustricola]|uniref:Uncharacterized protein n=1 Tax=Coniella lustricola TaxID=2025994 RepID=A0A2T3AH60_9PEZI|nr:hypothetical protein BD289DRAFT_491918 [Coniella lustricola]
MARWWRVACTITFINNDHAATDFSPNRRQCARECRGFHYLSIQDNIDQDDDYLNLRSRNAYDCSWSQWRFYPTGHWVVRSAFGQPCIPYEDTGPNLVGFSSGPIAVATTSDDGPTYQVRVNDTDPIFFYCAASGSCVDYHMIGVINPTANETYEKQYEYAENVTYQMTPGEAFPSETASSSSSSATSTSGGSSSSSSSSGHKSLSSGAIAGIAIGGAAVLLLAGVLIYLFGRRSAAAKAFAVQRDSGPYSGPMQEARYGGPAGPRSPGQATFATTAYSTAPSVDPYQMHMNQYGGPILVAGYPHSTGSPPPVSDYSQSLYQQHYGSVPQGLGSSPLVGLDAQSAAQTGMFPAPLQTNGVQAQHQQANAPIELPVSQNPGDEPLRQYHDPAKAYSWVQPDDGSYRPGKP